jgi:hypothetical protein
MKNSTLSRHKENTVKLNIQSEGLEVTLTNDDESTTILEYSRGEIELSIDVGALIEGVGALFLRAQSVENQLNENTPEDPLTTAMRAMTGSLGALHERMQRNNAARPDVPPPSDQPGPRTGPDVPPPGDIPGPDIDGADATGNNPNDPESPVGKSAI